MHFRPYSIQRAKCRSQSSRVSLSVFGNSSAGYSTAGSMKGLYPANPEHRSHLAAEDRAVELRARADARRAAGTPATNQCTAAFETSNPVFWRA